MNYQAYFPSSDRTESMHHGAEEFLLWLRDVFQQGLLSLEKNPSMLPRMAERMVDYKNGTIARRLRIMADRIGEDPDWPHFALEEFGELHLLAKALTNRKLSPASRLDAYQAAGYTIRKGKLPDPTPCKGVVLAVRYEQFERLRARKVFLLVDREPHYALLLDFAYGRSSFDQHWERGQWYQLESAFYPSAWPLRMRVFSRKMINSPGDNARFHRCENWKEAADFNWKRMGTVPWQNEWPFIIESIRPVQTGSGKWTLVDQTDRAPNVLSLQKEDEILWKILPFSAGKDFSAFCLLIDGDIEIQNVRKSGQQWNPVSL